MSELETSWSAWLVNIPPAERGCEAATSEGAVAVCEPLSNHVLRHGAMHPLTDLRCPECITATSTSAAVLLVSQDLPIAPVVGDLLLIWETSGAEEWVNRCDTLPL